MALMRYFDCWLIKMLALFLSIHQEITTQPFISVSINIDGAKIVIKIKTTTTSSGRFSMN